MKAIVRIFKFVFALVFCIAFARTEIGHSQGNTPAPPSNLQASPVHLVPPTNPIPASFFGMHIHKAGKQTAWPSVPIPQWRLWDAHVAWPDMEAREGQWNFSYLDSYLALAKAHETGLLLPLGLSPQWASARPTEKSAYQPGWAAEPKELDYWDTYVSTVVQHCKGQIHTYEIWNEPNYKPFWTGSTDQIVVLTHKAHDIIKATDPSAVLVSPAATRGALGVEWLDDFLTKGGGRYVDVIGFHFYTETPEKMIPLIQLTKAAMTRHNMEALPLWNTETGWSNPNPFPSPELAAAYLARAYILQWAAGVQRFYWYAWDNHGWVSIETTLPDSKTLTPAGQAYGVIQGWLVGAEMRSCDMSQDQTWVCHLHRAQGDQRIVWNAGGSTVTFDIPKAWKATSVTPLLGDPSRWTSATLQVDQMPRLIQ